MNVRPPSVPSAIGRVLLLSTLVGTTGCGELLQLDAFESYHGGSGIDLSNCDRLLVDSKQLYVVTPLGQAGELLSDCPTPQVFGSGAHRVGVARYAPNSGDCLQVTELASSAPLDVRASVQAGFDSVIITGRHEGAIGIGPPCGHPGATARQLALTTPGVAQMFLARLDQEDNIDETCVQWAQPISYPSNDYQPQPRAVGVSEDALALVGQLGGAQATAHGSDGNSTQLAQAGLGAFVASYEHCGQVRYFTGFGKGAASSVAQDNLDRADGVYLAESTPVVVGTVGSSIFD